MRIPYVIDNQNHKLADALNTILAKRAGNSLDIATASPDGSVSLRWWIDREALAAIQRTDGRYMLVTNDPSLTPTRMLALYRDKDAVEKRFRVFKQDLRVRPLFVHSDERLRAMLLVNWIALLAYSLLERQAQQHGVCLTARRVLERLSDWHVIEITAWDGQHRSPRERVDAGAEPLDHPPGACGGWANGAPGARPDDGAAGSRLVCRAAQHGPLVGHPGPRLCEVDSAHCLGWEGRVTSDQPRGGPPFQSPAAQAR